VKSDGRLATHRRLYPESKVAATAQRFSTTSLFFYNIMERPISGIFPTFVFNNIMEDTFIFSPRVFCDMPTTNELSYLSSIR
jgi:hypothetical protein